MKRGGMEDLGELFGEVLTDELRAELTAEYTAAQKEGRSIRLGEMSRDGLADRIERLETERERLARRVAELEAARDRAIMLHTKEESRGYRLDARVAELETENRLLRDGESLIDKKEVNNET